MKLTYVLTKAKAMEEGMQFAWEMGIRTTIFECDS